MQYITKRYNFVVLLIILCFSLTICCYPNAAYAYRQYDQYKVTENDKYATKADQYLYYRGDNPTPEFRIGHWQWEHVSRQDVTINGNLYRAFRPIYGPLRSNSKKGKPVGVPNDCIKTAQVIAAVIDGRVYEQTFDTINTTMRGFPEPYELLTDSTVRTDSPEVGEAYIGTTDDERLTQNGYFHAATVVHISRYNRQEDRITLESDPDPRNCSQQNISVSGRNIIFDMYNESRTRKSQSFLSVHSPYSRQFRVSLSQGSGLMNDIKADLGSDQERRLSKIMGIWRVLTNLLPNPVNNCSEQGCQMPRNDEL